MVDIHGFKSFRLDRSLLDDKDNIKKGGGIALYVKESIRTKSVHIDLFNQSSGVVECQWIELCYTNQHNIIIGNCYRQPQGNID